MAIGGNGNGAGSLPKWRFAFFAGLMLLVIVGGQYLGIPREVAVPVLIGCLIALANGELPKWFGKGSDGATGPRGGEGRDGREGREGRDGRDARAKGDE